MPTQPDSKKIIAHILSNWTQLGLPPTDLSKLKIKILPFRRSGLHSLLNYMFFSEKELLLVIKMPRYNEGKLAFAALKNEAKMLDYLSEKGILKGHLPQVYELLELDGFPILLLKAYAGEMLHHFLDKEEDLTKLEALIMSAAGLLPQLYSKKSSQQKTIDQKFLQTHLKDPLKLMVEHYPAEAAAIDKFLKSFLESRNFLNLKFPTVCLHREFNPWNILREADGNLILLDWEDSLAQELPLLDLFNYFIVSFRIIFYGETKHAQERNLETKKKRVKVLLKTYSTTLKQYCQELGLPPELEDLFYVIFALNATQFFIEEKRREIDYGKSWLALLLNVSLKNCFLSFIENEQA